MSVIRVDVAQLVPGGTGPLRHDVRVAVVGLGAAAVAEIQLDLDPLACLGQRGLRLGVLVLRVEGDRLVVLDLRQLDREHVLRQRVGDTVGVVDDGEGLAPVTDRKSTRLNSSHVSISYAVFCLKKKTKT